jgi:MoxR-like ATPase
MVLATQNPLEHHGTYPLAEAQVDRFMMHLRLAYPGKSEEREILRLAANPSRREVNPVLSTQELLEARQRMEEVHVDARIQDYLVELVHATRDPGAAGLPALSGLISMGVSPRAGIALQAGARARAFLTGRSFVLPEDVKELAPDVLRHRLILSYEAEAQGLDPDEVLKRVLSVVPVP